MQIMSYIMWIFFQKEYFAQQISIPKNAFKSYEVIDIKLFCQPDIHY